MRPFTLLPLTPNPSPTSGRGERALGRCERKTASGQRAPSAACGLASTQTSPLSRREGASCRWRLVLAALVPILLFLLPVPAWADDILGPKEKFFQPKLGDQAPFDLAFRDEADRPVQLGGYFRDKPVILVLAYYQCPMLCKLVLKDLVDGLKRIPFTAGQEFEVVVVSFDPREKPDLAARHKAAYVESYGRPNGANGWHFLTGEQPEITRLTEAVGFRAVWDEKGQQFAHARGIMILTPRGVVARYFLEGVFPPRDLRLALVEASEGKVGVPMDRILLMCFNYDPDTGKYSAAILRMVRVGGIATLLALFTFWMVCWRRERRAARARAEATKAQGPLVAG
jgi:protein SCO1